MMKNHFEMAMRFVDKVSGIKHILQIVLFGSVARGDDTVQSDIDIAIIHDHKNRFAIMKEVNKFKLDTIQTTFIHRNDLSKEIEIVSALTGEGLLLYGSPITLPCSRLPLVSKVLITYSMAGLSQAQKMKVNRALFGSVSVSKSHGKDYKTVVKGIANEPGVTRINKGVLLADRRRSGRIIRMLKRFKVDVKEIPFFTY